MKADLVLVSALAAADNGLAVVSTLRDDGTVHSAVVNAGVTSHPVDGSPVLAFVARPGVKLRNLRRTGRATVVLRHAWEWVAVEGDVDLVGPDDDRLSIGSDQTRLPLRQVFHAAGGQHDDLTEYDRVMADERRTAVLVRPERLYTNPPHARHLPT
jgi:PPOX class probable F420-dependent enzyme